MSINEIVTLVLRVVVFILIAFIEAAEQVFGKDQGPEKKEWVRGRLAALGIDVDLDVIDAEIEACVLLLHNALKG